MIRNQQQLQKSITMSDVFHGKFVIKDPTSCPNCGLFAHGLAKIVELFGLRNMRDGTVRVQSWCKACRRPLTRNWT